MAAAVRKRQISCAVIAARAVEQIPLITLNYMLHQSVVPHIQNLIVCLFNMKTFG